MSDHNKNIINGNDHQEPSRDLPLDSVDQILYEAFSETKSPVPQGVLDQDQFEKFVLESLSSANPVMEKPSSSKKAQSASGFLAIWESFATGKGPAFAGIAALASVLFLTGFFWIYFFEEKQIPAGESVVLNEKQIESEEPSIPTRSSQQSKKSRTSPPRPAESREIAGGFEPSRSSGMEEESSNPEEAEDRGDSVFRSTTAENGVLEGGSIALTDKVSDEPGLSLQKKEAKSSIIDQLLKKASSDEERALLKEFQSSTDQENRKKILNKLKALYSGANRQTKLDLLKKLSP